MIFKECNNKILFKLVKDKDKQEEIIKKLNILNLINNILNEIDKINKYNECINYNASVIKKMTDISEEINKIEKINKNSENISISTLKILRYIMDDIEKGNV